MEGIEFVKKWLGERGFEKYCVVFEGINDNKSLTLDNIIFENLKNPRISNWVSGDFANYSFAHSARQVGGSIIRIAR